MSSSSRRFLNRSFGHLLHRPDGRSEVNLAYGPDLRFAYLGPEVNMLLNPGNVGDKEILIRLTVVAFPA